MKKMILPALLLGLAFLLPGNQAKAATTDAVTVHYSAAASLKDTLTDISQKYQKKNPNVKIELDFAGSGQIKQKVLSGAPIDGVLTASKADMDALTSKDKAKDSFVLLKNDLVLIQNKKDKKIKGSMTKQLKSAEKIAVGQPDTVPAGRYAIESMTYLKLNKKLEPNFVYANDVRQVLAFVGDGNADLGFVYRTDAKISNKVRVLRTVPGKYHQPILYYVGDTATDSAKSAAVQKFNKYLKGKTAKKIFEKADFKMAKE